MKTAHFFTCYWPSTGLLVFGMGLGERQGQGLGLGLGLGQYWDQCQGWGEIEVEVGVGIEVRVGVGLGFGLGWSCLRQFYISFFLFYDIFGFYYISRCYVYIYFFILRCFLFLTIFFFILQYTQKFLRHFFFSIWRVYTIFDQQSFT